MSKGNRNRQIRERLMEVDNHCHWCGIEVVWYLLKEGERTPGNFATLDHIYTMLEPEKRFEAGKNGDPNRHVLACNSCNKKRNEERCKLYPKEAWKIRTQLGQERKKILSNQPRPQIFRGLENIEQH